jgi:hypothetical protein
MPFVMNASSKEQSVQAHGAWFTFSAGQIKEMGQSKVDFLTSNKAYMGFVAVPEEFADLDYRNSPEGKAKLEQIRTNGISNRIKHLEWLKNNELKSLRKDMDKANIKAEVESEMTDESTIALKGALEELKGYQAKKSDPVKERAAQIRELEAALSSDE